MKNPTIPENNPENDILTISNIYKSFEDLEKSLTQLNMIDIHSMINLAKQSFSDSVFEQIKKHREIP